MHANEFRNDQDAVGDRRDRPRRAGRRPRGETRGDVGLRAGGRTTRMVADRGCRRARIRAEHRCGVRVMRGNAELLATASLWPGRIRVVAAARVGKQRLDEAQRGLIIGGGAGNLVERFGDGYVTDYIAVGPWPRFNIADSAITLAIAVFAVALLRQDTGADSDAALEGEASEDNDDERA